MALDQELVDSCLQKAKGSHFFGIPIEELSHDELITFGIMGWESVESSRKQYLKDMDFLNSLHKR